MNRMICFVIACATFGRVNIDPGYSLLGEDNRSTGTVVAVSTLAAGITGLAVYFAARAKSVVTTVPASLKSKLDSMGEDRQYAAAHARELVVSQETLDHRAADLAAQTNG